MIGMVTTNVAKIMGSATNPFSSELYVNEQDQASKAQKKRGTIIVRAESVKDSTMQVTY